MKFREDIIVHRNVISAGLLTISLFALGCTPGDLSAKQKTEMIARLQSARQQDEQNAADLATDPADAVDSLHQAYKADRAIRKLEHGTKVDQDEFADATEIPPASFSPQQKASLIRQLEKIKADDALVVPPIAGESFRQRIYDQHAELVAGVINDLEIGDDVPWSRIQQALTSPQVR